MIQLQREGLYIAQGVNTNILIRVAGVAPMLTIVSGVCLNSMNKNGEVKALTPEDPEIQDIICNPMNYVYEYPALSEAINAEDGLDRKETGNVEYSREQFDNWCDEYKDYISLYRNPTEYRSKFLIYLMKETEYSINQARMIISQIERKIKTE